MLYGIKETELDKLTTLFAQNQRIESVILYGSRAKGNYKPFSDVDITLKGENLTRSDLNQLSLAIDDLLFPYEFDVSIFHKLKNEKLIEHINGVCLAEFVELTRGEVNEAIKRAFNIIRDVGITEYSGLLDFLEDNGYGDEWDVVKNNVILFNTYITSRRYAEQRMAENIGRVALAQNREKSRDK